MVYGDGDEIFISDEVIAWRIEVDPDGGEGLITSTHPVTIDGDAGSNWLGYVHPDGTVTVLDERFDDWEAAQIGRREFLKRGA